MSTAAYAPLETVETSPTREAQQEVFEWTPPRCYARQMAELQAIRERQFSGQQRYQSFRLFGSIFLVVISLLSSWVGLMCVPLLVCTEPGGNAVIASTTLFVSSIATFSLAAVMFYQYIMRMESEFNDMAKD